MKVCFIRSMLILDWYWYGLLFIDWLIKSNCFASSLFQKRCKESWWETRVTRNSGGRSQENKEARSDLVVCVFALCLHITSSKASKSAEQISVCSSKRNVHLLKEKIKKYVSKHAVGEQPAPGDITKGSMDNTTNQVVFFCPLLRPSRCFQRCKWATRVSLAGSCKQGL